MPAAATDPDLVAQAVINVLTQTGHPVGTIASIVKRTPDAPLTGGQVPILEIKPVQNVHTRVAAALTKMDVGWLELTYRDAPVSQQQALTPSLTLTQIEDRNWANRNAILAALDADPKLALGDDQHPAVSDAASQVDETWKPDGPFAEWQGAEWVVWYCRMNYKGPKQNLQDTALKRSLLAYWSFDEDTGTTVADSSGDGITGTWGGTLGSQWGPGIIHSGGVFNGTDNLVDLGAQSRLSFAAGAAFSVSGWVKPSAVTRSSGFVVNGTHGSCYNWRLTLLGTGAGNEALGAGFAFDNGVLAPMTLAAHGIFLSVWTHVVLTYAGGSLLAYINGVAQPVQAQLLTPSCTGQSVKIGSSTADSSIFDFFGGTLDEVGIWGRALSLGDVQALYNGGTGRQYPFS